MRKYLYVFGQDIVLDEQRSIFIRLPAVALTFFDRCCAGLARAKCTRSRLAAPQTSGRFITVVVLRAFIDENHLLTSHFVLVFILCETTGSVKSLQARATASTTITLLIVGNQVLI